MGQIMINGLPHLKVSMKKDKRSKAKDKSHNDQIPVSSGILSSFRDNNSYPFKRYSDQINPFTQPNSKFNTLDKALGYQLVIDLIVEFASECTDHIQWDFGEKKHIREKIPALKKQIKEITKQLEFLIPTDANSTRRTAVLRIFEAKPQFLVEHVEMFKLRLEYYDLYQTKESLKIKGNPGRGREKAIKIFMEKTLKAKYQKIALTNTSSSSNIALSFLAHFYSCNFDVLKNIYSKTPKKRKTEIHDIIKSSPSEYIKILQNYLFIQ